MSLKSGEDQTHGINEEFILALLTTKYKDWAYERESRVFADLKESDENDLYYIDFGPTIQIREIILGARCNLSVGSVAKAVGKSACPVRVTKARAAFDSFEIVRQKNITPINIKAASA